MDSILVILQHDMLRKEINFIGFVEKKYYYTPPFEHMIDSNESNGANLTQKLNDL